MVDIKSKTPPRSKREYVAIIAVCSICGIVVFGSLYALAGFFGITGSAVRASPALISESITNLGPVVQNVAQNAVQNAVVTSTIVEGTSTMISTAGLTQVLSSIPPEFMLQTTALATVTVLGLKPLVFLFPEVNSAGTAVIFHTNSLCGYVVPEVVNTYAVFPAYAPIPITTIPPFFSNMGISQAFLRDTLEITPEVLLHRQNHYTLLTQSFVLYSTFCQQINDFELFFKFRDFHVKNNLNFLPSMGFHNHDLRRSFIKDTVQKLSDDRRISEVSGKLFLIFGAVELERTKMFGQTVITSQNE